MAGYPGTLYVDQATFASQGLGFKVFATMFSLHKEFFKNFFTVWKFQCALSILKPSEKHRTDVGQNYQDLLSYGTHQSAKEPKQY